MQNTTAPPDPQAEKKRKQMLLRQCAQLKFEQKISERLRRLIFLCHPDKHGGDKNAEGRTTWLLGLKDRFQGEPVRNV